MTPIETIALILALVSVIKLLTLIASPSSWYSNKNPLVSILTGRTVGPIVSLILAAVVLKYLLQEVSIVQIFAVTAFIALLLMVSIAPYSRSLMNWLRDEASRNGNVLRSSWLAVLVWVVLIIWVIKDIFAI